MTLYARLKASYWVIVQTKLHEFLSVKLKKNNFFDFFLHASHSTRLREAFSFCKMEIKFIAFGPKSDIKMIQKILFWQLN